MLRSLLEAERILVQSPDVEQSNTVYFAPIIPYNKKPSYHLDARIGTRGYPKANLLCQ